MKIPKRVKIGTTVYKVKMGEIKDAWGTTNFIDATITLSTFFNKQYKEGTFLHEIIEAINTQYDLKLNHRQLAMVSEVLFTVLKENKLLKDK